MLRVHRGAVFALLFLLFFRLITGVYVGEVISSAGDPEEVAFYPGPNPAQYLPILAVIPVPTTPPPPPPPILHNGLQLQWDGEGYIYFDDYYWNPGTHLTRAVDQQIDADTVRVASQQWYSPNPFGWQDEVWYCHYNTFSNRAELCSVVNDPAWKWGYYWILPADMTLASGQTTIIDGQVFTATGPHIFLTAYGEEAHFWRMVNQDRFLIHNNSGEWKQYVERGDAILFYEFTGSGLLLYSNIKRTYYKNDERTADTVRYEDYLTRFDGVMNVAVELRQVETQSKEVGWPVATISADGIEAIIGAQGIDPSSLSAQP